MIKIYVLVLLLSHHLAAVGQNLIASSGGTYSSGNVHLEFTLGEPVIETISGSTVTVTQ